MYCKYNQMFKLRNFLGILWRSGKIHPCKPSCIPLKWNVKAVTKTGTTVNRSKNEVCWSKCGISLGICILPAKRAAIAIPEHMTTNATARRVDIAELNFKESADHQPIWQLNKGCWEGYATFSSTWITGKHATFLNLISDHNCNPWMT